jgi:DNA-directed RNA polymerase subunit A'
MIGEIRFGLLSPQEIMKLGVVKITTADTYDKDGYPISGGLMDPHLGVIDPGIKCRTCGGKSKECHGHFGIIALARPVIHVGHAKLVYKMLRSICPKCSRICLEEESAARLKEELSKSKNPERKDMILDRAFKIADKAKACPFCGEEKPSIGFEKPTHFYQDGQRLTPSDIRERLEQIPDEYISLLGMDPRAARPEWIVLTVLPVPPVTVRPSITLESGDRSEDDLTHKLVDIVRINQRLQENMAAGAPQLIVDDLWDLLQYHVTTYFDNEISGVPPARHRSGRPLKTLSQRLKGKEGRFRSNLSGKRVDFSARTVISPDPCLSINEGGVPEEISKELTVPERVTDMNIESMRKLVVAGSSNHPGANYVLRPDGSRKKVTEENKAELSEELEPGYIVERHLRDGDIVLLNRQPSLHRMSIMAHRVRVMPFKTFRLNLCVCPPYNADFDGDEMNLHVIQTEEARAEARMLMEVQEHILSPRVGGPLIGCIHDHISGSYYLTKEGSYYTRWQAEQKLKYSGLDTKLPRPAKTVEGVRMWSGKQIFSKTLPKDLNMQFKAKICQKCEVCKGEECDREAYVVIENGELKRGVIDAAAIGAYFEGRVLDEITRTYGSDRAREFLDQVTRLAVHVVSKKGYTISIDDYDIPEQAREGIAEVLERGEEDVGRLIEAYNKEELEHLPGKSLEETLEMRIMEILSKARNRAGEIAERHLGMERNTVAMARTGARASMLDLTQITACIGPQAVRGKRLHRGYSNRSLSHFEENDLGARARGFVKSSYKDGLDPLEFFFHAMSGREGLVDTAIRTAQSGYMQRRLINALQDLRVDYDSTVRDTRGVIVQFRYGEDGVDPARKKGDLGVDTDTIMQEVLGA